MEGTGPNKLGTTSTPCRDLNFTSMGENAEVSGNTKGQITGTGPNKLGTTAAPLGDSIIRTNDTQPESIEGGTLESNGMNTMGAV